MAPGIETRIAVATPGDCPVAAASAEAGAAVSSVHRSRTGDGTVTEEFALPRDATPGEPSVSAVADFGEDTVYRFERDAGEGCVCELVEELAGPVVDTHARDGVLFVTIRTRERSTVREVVGRLQNVFDGVRVCYMHRAGDCSQQDPVVVDRAALTERQREVLRTAHAMGYFEHPKGANASEVADSLDICRATLTEHLSAALRKVTDRVVRADDAGGEACAGD